MKRNISLIGYMFIVIVIILPVACKNDSDPCSHNGNWTISVFPVETELEIGEETRTCTICGEIENRAMSLATFKTYFYGTWAHDEYPNTGVIIDENEWTWYEGDNTETNDIIEWKPRENDTTDSSIFPFGFLLEGDGVSNTFYINSTKNKINSSPYSEEIFSKNP